MPPRNEDIKLESSSIFEPKSRKKLVIIGVAVIFFIGFVASTALVLTYGAKRKAAKARERESVLGVETSKENEEIALPSPTTTPSPSPATVFAPSPSPTPGPQVKASDTKLTFTSEVLDINFQYPDNWKVETTKINVKGSGYRFDCKDKVTLDQFIKDGSKCPNDEIEPENIVVTGPNGERVVFWNINKVAGSCPLNNDFRIIILGRLKTFTPVMTEGKVSPCYGLVFDPGMKSNWKSYRIDFSGTPKQYDDIEILLMSIKHN
jgi:hypothetical protein